MIVSRVNGTDVVYAKHLREHLGIPADRFRRYMTKGWIPEPDGKTHTGFGKSGVYGRYWLLSTIRRWAVSPEAGRVTQNVSCSVEVEEYDVVDLYSQPTVNMSDIMARELGLSSDSPAEDD